MQNAKSRATFHFYLVFRRYFASFATGHAPTKTLRSPRSGLQQCPRLANTRFRFASTGKAPVQKESLRPQTYYDIFPTSLSSGAPPNGSFHINPAVLRKEFLQLQAIAHPDRHQGVDKAKAETASAVINDAYRTLLNPLARARYLLSLHGVEMAEDESIAGSPSDSTGGMDAGLLMEVMEVREDIEAAQSRQEIEEMKAHNDARKEASEDRLDHLFRAGDIEGARRETVRLGYWVNVGTALENWEKAGDGRVSEHD
ncbi:MAG: hypothetical protein L6R40_007113 [Gallowayella cf. fulva]|nr:MAG: hypothetical protein L6R40_007113 [Xanthomendoza cf. fulva]